MNLALIDQGMYCVLATGCRKLEEHKWEWHARTWLHGVNQVMFCYIQSPNRNSKLSLDQTWPEASPLRGPLCNFRQWQEALMLQLRLVLGPYYCTWYLTTLTQHQLCKNVGDFGKSFEMATKHQRPPDKEAKERQHRQNTDKNRLNMTKGDRNWPGDLREG